MREIDDRYPEFAEPYEPVKGGKHHSAVTFARPLKAMAAARATTLAVTAALVFAVVGPSIAKKPSPVDPGPVIVVTPTPTPEETATPTPETTPTPEIEETPTPEPEETPTAVPEESPTPVPFIPVITPTPTPVPVITPTPTPVPEITPTPTPEITPTPTPVTYDDPGFTRVSTEHKFKEENGDVTVDTFIYSFAIDLKDADTSKPITVRLQTAPLNSDSWTDVSAGGDTVSTKKYEDTGTTWEGDLSYDVYALDLGDSSGMLQKVRILCEYTMPEGTKTSEIYSTSTNTNLFAYAGQYLEAQSGTYTPPTDTMAGTLTATFKVDTSLVQNTGTDKLSAAKVTLYPGYDEDVDITGRATVSPVSNDGTVTVTFTFDDTDPSPEEGYYLTLRMAYTDDEYGVNNWQSEDEVFIEVPEPEPEPLVAPAFTEAGSTHSEFYLDQELKVDYFGYSFTISLNDIDRDVKHTVRLQHAELGSNDWTDIPEDNDNEFTIDYEGSDADWSDSISYYVFDNPNSFGGKSGMLKQVRFAMDYTLTDGTPGTIWSTDINDLYAYGGQYLSGESAEIVKTNDNRNGTLTAVFKADTSLVKDTSSLSKADVSLYSGSSYYEITDDAGVSVNSDGTITVTYQMTGEEPEPEGEYFAGLTMSYNDENFNIEKWQSTASAPVTVRDETTYTVPAFEGVDSRHSINSGTDEEYWDMFGYGFRLNLNDAVPSSVTVRLEYDSYDGSAWIDVPDAANTVKSLTYTGTDTIWEILLDDEEASPLIYDVFDVPLNNQRGMIWNVRIACDYEFPDGSPGETVYSNADSSIGTLTAYKGDYLEPVSGTIGGNQLNAEFKLDTSLVKNADLISLSETDTTDEDNYYWVGELHLEWGPGMNERIQFTDFKVVEISGDKVTVSLDTGDLVLDAQRSYSLGLELVYTEKERHIDKWDSYAVVSLEIDPKDPFFTEKPTVERESDLFRYSFTIDLQDADRSKDLSVSLQYLSENNQWVDCEESDNTVSTLSYTGTGNLWEGELVYDVAPIKLDEGEWFIREMRIVCDYTLIGEEDPSSIDSTDKGSLYSYKGDYITAQYGELDGNGEITATFRVDTELVKDTSKLKVTLNENEVTSAVVSQADQDGMITVTYKLTNAEQEADVRNYLGLGYSYDDSEKDIKDWQSSDKAYVYVKPVIELSFDRLGEGIVGHSVEATITMNDVSGGAATLTLYKVKEDGSLQPVTGEISKYVYDPEYEEDGIITAYLDDGELEDEWYWEDGVGVRYPAKIVMDYTYPDGPSGSLETEEYDQCAGDFAKYINDPPIYYDEETNSLVAEIAIDLSLVDIDHLKEYETSSWIYYIGSYDSDYLGEPELKDEYDGKDGTWRMIYMLPLEEFTKAHYTFNVVFVYETDYGRKWETSVFTEETIPALVHPTFQFMPIIYNDDRTMVYFETAFKVNDLNSAEASLEIDEPDGELDWLDGSVFTEAYKHYDYNGQNDQIYDDKYPEYDCYLRQGVSLNDLMKESGETVNMRLGVHVSIFYSLSDTWTYGNYESEKFHLYFGNFLESATPNNPDRYAELYKYDEDKHLLRIDAPITDKIKDVNNISCSDIVLHSDSENADISVKPTVTKVKENGINYLRLEYDLGDVSLSGICRLSYTASFDEDFDSNGNSINPWVQDYNVALDIERISTEINTEP